MRATDASGANRARVFPSRADAGPAPRRAVAGGPRGTRFARWRGGCLAAFLGVAIGAGLRAATIEVEGAGFFRDRELRTALVRVADARAKPTLDANAIEDAAR